MTFLFFNSQKVVLVKDFLVKHLKLVLRIGSFSYFGTHPVNFSGYKKKIALELSLLNRWVSLFCTLDTGKRI